MVTGDPHRDFDAYENKKHESFIKLPTCDCCGERIVEDFLYDFDGELVCDECLTDYISDNYKKNASAYIDEFYD